MLSVVRKCETLKRFYRMDMEMRECQDGLRCGFAVDPTEAQHSLGNRPINVRRLAEFITTLLTDQQGPISRSKSFYAQPKASQSLSSLSSSSCIPD